MTKYGHFSESGDEYIITRPDTPKPWINFLTNGRYCALISQTGGGYSFIGDAGFNRILDSDPDEITITDRPGRYIYIRDDMTGEYWSLGWQPTRRPLDFFQASHGLGYTTIKSEKKKIYSEATFFVPLDDDLEIWKCKLENFSKLKRKISVIIYAEWSLANHDANLAEASFNNLFNDIEFEDNIIFASKTRWNRPDFDNLPWDKYAFLTMDRTVDGCVMNKEEFIGMYGDLHDPKMLEEFNWSSQKKLSGDGQPAVGVLCKKFVLQPGAKIDFNVLLGASEKTKQVLKYGLVGTENVRKVVKKYSDAKKVKLELERVKQYWKDYNDHLQVTTPDKNFDISVNYWNRYQSWVTSRWSLMCSFYTGGSSTYGFRDMSQHLIGILPHDADYAKKRLLELYTYQLAEGKTVHNWNAFTHRGVVTNHSDDPQWLILSTIFYLNETGNLALLDQKVNFYDEGRDTVLNHLLKAINYTVKISSKRGIPHRLTADWNDAMNSGKQGRGESTMVANQLCWNILNLKDIFSAIGREDLNEKYLYTYNKVKKSLNKDFWDGEWYIRATGDNGKAIGSKVDKYNQIDINAQTWSVMSGVAQEDSRAVKSMNSVWKRLDTKYGPAMFLPSYKVASEEFGLITEFTPGTKENGSIFNHPVSWAVLAETLIGRGEKAYEWWKKTLFITRSQEDSIYQCEPYVYSEFVYGPEHSEFGKGSFSWATGSASWFYRVCTDYILGIRPTLKGLEIDPCVPSDWKEFKIKRDFRGATYEITIKNPKGVCYGVEKILIDGVEYDNSILPIYHSGIKQIEVIMGKPIINKDINFYR